MTRLTFASLFSTVCARMLPAVLPAVLAATVLPVGAYAQTQRSTQASTVTNGDADAALIAKGRYLATAADCAACHTAPKSVTPFAGGYVIDSPMGGIVSSNITPSLSNGIGGWTEAEFTKAVRQGVSPQGNLYPAMPYPNYSTISDEDMHALWAYFHNGVKPVDQTPETKTSLAFPFNQRWLMMGWNLFFARGTPANPADVAPGGPKRGAYLVRSLEHCEACHSPRNMLMGENFGDFLGGGDLGGWKAPNITSDAVSGIGGWSNQDIVDYLRTGTAHGKAQAAGPMAEAVSHSLRFLSNDDLLAIATYLKSVPAVRTPGQLQPAFGVADAQPVALGALDRSIDRDPKSMTDATSLDGQRLYVAACASCHQMNGQGTKDQFYPSLTHNSATGGITPANLVMAITQGIDRQTNGGTVSMPAFSDQLSNAQIAQVSDYVLQRFGNTRLHVSESDVVQLRQGGNKPFLLQAVPYLIGISIAVCLLVIVAIVMLLRRRQIHVNNKARR